MIRGYNAGDLGPLGMPGFIREDIIEFEDVVIKESKKYNGYSLFIPKIGKSVTVSEETVEISKLSEVELMDLIPRRANVLIDKNNLILENYFEKIIITDFMTKNKIFELKEIIIDQQI